MVKAIRTGFQSLRELLTALVGAYGFWYQVTRVKEPDVQIIVVCGLLVASSGALAMYRPDARIAADDLDALVRELVRDALAEHGEGSARPAARKSRRRQP